MPDPDGGPSIGFTDFRKELDQFNKEFEKKLKALKLDPKVAKQAKLSLFPTQKDLLKQLAKQEENGQIPLKKLEPVAKKKCKKMFNWIHVKPSPGIPPGFNDGIKITFGSKSISAGLKIKYDNTKSKLKFEPVAGLTFRFR